MRKLTPITLSEESNSKLQEQLGVQVIEKGTPKSADPQNYPVFNIPVGKKVLIYVPNHVTLDAEGIPRLRMDKPFTHSITIGKRYLTHRCTNGIEIEGTGLTGRCPLCDGVSEPWELANKIIEQKCKAQGLDPANTDDENVKAIRSAEFSKRVIKDADRHFTFPIVVFETLNDDGKTFVKTEDGKGVKYRVYWYDISENLWDEKWAKVIEALNDESEEDVTHPGGRFYLLNYIYSPKNGKQQEARDAARALNISVRKISNSEAMRSALDKETEGWTPAKCQQTVLANVLYAEEDLQSVADEALENTRNLLAMYNSASAGAIGIGGGNAGFQLEKVEDNDGEGTVAGELPMETDIDVEE